MVDILLLSIYLLATYQTFASPLYTNHQSCMKCAVQMLVLANAQTFWTLGSISEPHFFDAGIDPRPWSGPLIYTCYFHCMSQSSDDIKNHFLPMRIKKSKENKLCHLHESKISLKVLPQSTVCILWRHKSFISSSVRRSQPFVLSCGYLSCLGNML